MRRGCDIGLTDIQMINLFAVIGCCNGKRMEFTHGGKVACQSLLRDFHGRSLRKSFFVEEKADKTAESLFAAAVRPEIILIRCDCSIFFGFCATMFAPKKGIFEGKVLTGKHDCVCGEQKSDEHKCKTIVTFFMQSTCNTYIYLQKRVFKR